MQSEEAFSFVPGFLSVQISSDDEDGQDWPHSLCVSDHPCPRGSVHINHNTPGPQESDRVIYHRVTATGLLQDLGYILKASDE